MSDSLELELELDEVAVVSARMLSGGISSFGLPAGDRSRSTSIAVKLLSDLLLRIFSSLFAAVLGLHPGVAGFSCDVAALASLWSMSGLALLSVPLIT